MLFAAAFGVVTNSGCPRKHGGVVLNTTVKVCAGAAESFGFGTQRRGQGRVVRVTERLHNQEASSRHCTKCSNERSKEISAHCGAAKSFIGAQRVKRQCPGGSQLNQVNTAHESDPTDRCKVEIKKGWGRREVSKRQVSGWPSPAKAIIRQTRRAARYNPENNHCNMKKNIRQYHRSACSSAPSAMMEVGIRT